MTQLSDFPRFPRTEVGGVSLPRMLAGTNWMLGYSHTGPAADEMIKSRHADPQNVSAVLDAYMEYNIDAMPERFARIAVAMGIDPAGKTTEEMA